MELGADSIKIGESRAGSVDFFKDYFPMKYKNWKQRVTYFFLLEYAYLLMQAKQKLHAQRQFISEYQIPGDKKLGAIITFLLYFIHS